MSANGSSEEKKKKRPLKDNLYFINAMKIALLLTHAIILPTLKTETSGTGGGGGRVGKEKGGRLSEEGDGRKGEKNR